MELPTFDLRGEIPPAQIIFRAFLKKSHFVDEGNLRLANVTSFLRRKDNDHKGLSIAPTTEAAQAFLTKKFGCCKFVTSEIHAIHPGILVVADTTDHGNITNVPRPEEDEEVALKIARGLQRLARKDPLPIPP